MTEVKIEDDVGSSVLMTGNNAPTFGGDPEDFERWARLVRSWKKLSTMKPEKHAHKIMLSQTNAEVLEVMMSIDEEAVDGPIKGRAGCIQRIANKAFKSVFYLSTKEDRVHATASAAL